MPDAIITSESLLVGAIEIEGTCQICRQVTKQRVGYAFTRCDGCGAEYNVEDIPRRMRLRREYLGLSRKEMADRFGVKPSTIATYETWWPSIRYFEFLKTIEV